MRRGLQDELDERGDTLADEVGVQIVEVEHAPLRYEEEVPAHVLFGEHLDVWGDSQSGGPN